MSCSTYSIDVTRGSRVLIVIFILSVLGFIFVLVYLVLRLLQVDSRIREVKQNIREFKEVLKTRMDDGFGDIADRLRDRLELDELKVKLDEFCESLAGRMLPFCKERNAVPVP